MTVHSRRKWWKLNPRSTLAFTHDVAAAAVAWFVAFLLRFNFVVPPDFSRVLFVTIGWVVLVDAAIFLSFRLYRGLWRYASIHDLKLLMTAVGVAALAAPAVVALLDPNLVVPRSVYILHPILLAMLMGGSRLSYRAWKDRKIGKLGALYGKPVIILGAGDAAISLLKDLAGSREWRVIGLLDDDARKLGRQILGAPVLGTPSDLGSIAGRYEIRHAIIAMPSASRQIRKRLVELCQASDIRPLTVPSFDDLMDGKVAVSQIRQIELDDLLGREPVVLDTAGLQHLIGGRTVLVTGAGGSIGSELCRQIAKFAPANLVLFELSEYALYEVEQEFRERFPHLNLTCVIGDVKSEVRVERTMARFRPHIVFHAAAYKHVPLMETENAWEAVRNNVHGTRVVAAAAIRHRAERFVLVSTDKAVNPTNVMGASKRLAEMVCQALAAQGSTRMVMVRFGNVLGSTGSVIPKFRRQIAQGGPVTVTHPEITRYFMSIPEAAQLVLQAAVMGGGGEIFVLDMGDPVRIVDLARDMIRLSGLAQDEVRIVFTGLRPGEKLFEELLADGEATVATPHPKLRIAKARDCAANLLPELEHLLARTEPMEDSDARAMLARLVPEYRPSGDAGDAERREAGGHSAAAG